MSDKIIIVKCCYNYNIKIFAISKISFNLKYICSIISTLYLIEIENIKIYPATKMTEKNEILDDENLQSLIDYNDGLSLNLDIKNGKNINI
jgi:hypothetical protein